jgi:hypothetical protein
MLKITSRRHTCRRIVGAVVAALATAALTQADAQTVARTTSSAPAAVHAKSHAPLDLHTPPLNHIYPSSELRYILAVDESGTDSATEVSIKSDKYTVRVPGAPGNQLQAVPWALLHPTQAWRIFTPLEEP